MDKKLEGLKAHNQDLETLTIKSIEDAFALLLEKKNYEDISIKEICLKAGVSRTSFYAHFKNKKDVIDSVNLEVVNAVITSENIKFDKSIADKNFYMNIFSMLEERIRIMKIYVSKGFQYRPVYGFYLSLRLSHVSQAERQRKMAWFAALEGVIYDWLKDNKRQSKEEISEFCFKNLTPILN